VGQSKSLKDNFWLRNSIQKLMVWIEDQQFASYDNYDFSSSKFGIISKRIYFNKKYKALGFPLAGFLYLLDSFFPFLRKLFAAKMISAEAIPYFAVGYFRLYELEHSDVYLHKALNCLDWLKRNYKKTKSGLGWGLHFNWQSLKFLPKGTPCVTVTSHSTDAFLKGYEITKKQEYLDIAIKTAEFALNDLNRTVFDEHTVAVSYTPKCKSLVINANSYCANILYKIWDVTQDKKYIELADKVINYILHEQKDDGSWFYFGENQFEANFIDNFHTCLVLENLFKIYCKTKSRILLRSIEKGFDFFKNLFLDSLETSVKSALWTIKNMQSSKGYFYFRIYKTHKNKMPYMRWGQAPMFNALTYLFWKSEKEDNG